MTRDALCRLIDHAILQPTVTLAEMEAEIAALEGLPLASLCVRPFAVREAVRRARVPVGVVVGFPHGGERWESKRDEAARAVDDGAADIDMVVNVGFVRGEDDAQTAAEISAVLDVARRHNAVLKVIFENAYLDDRHKLRLCRICAELGVDFVKTSTGFAYRKGSDGAWIASGATLADVRLMRDHTPPEIGVKASGGIRSLESLRSMLEAGANRIGTAATLSILQELSSEP